jgi:lysyl-tRNA synthetase class I
VTAEVVRLPLLCAKCGRLTLTRLERSSCKKPVRYSCSNLACAEHQRSRKFIGKVEIV